MTKLEEGWVAKMEEGWVAKLEEGWVTKLEERLSRRGTDFAKLKMDGWLSLREMAGQVGGMGG